MPEAKRRKLNPAEDVVDADADASGEEEDDAFESEEAAGIAILTQLGEHLISGILNDEGMDTITQAIEIGAPLWYQNEEEGISALHAAAYMQNEELVKLLLKKGAVWNAGARYISLIQRYAHGWDSGQATKHGWRHRPLL